LERLEAARTALTQRKDMQAEWVITTFRSVVDGLKAGTVSPDPSPIPPRTTSSNPDPRVDIGILKRLGFLKSGQMLAISLGGPKRGYPNRKGDFSSSSTCATVDDPVQYLWSAIPNGRLISCLA
jgi:hypothetical protein